MVDTTEFGEGLYLNPDVVVSSPTRVGVVLSEAKPKAGKFGQQLECELEMDGKNKLWSLNKDSVKNMQQLGKDSKAWVGKPVRFEVMMVNGKRRVIGAPERLQA